MFYTLIFQLIFSEEDSQYTNYDNGIFISGGLTVERNSQNQSSDIVSNDAVYKLNLKSSKWEEFSIFESKRCGHQSTIIEDLMCSVGGFDGSYLADTEITSISGKDKTQSFTIPTMNYKRRSFGMCSFAGCIFVAGGYDNGEILDKCEVYSTESSKWIEASGMNTKRCAFPLIYFQDNIWAIGGYNGHAFLDTIEVYYLADNKWTTVDTKLLPKRCGHRAVAHKKKFFVVGGVCQGTILYTVEVYSSETSQFSFVSPMSQARADFGCILFNNNLFVFGGQNNESEISNSVEVYDIEKQVWSKGPSLPVPLAQFGYSNKN